MDRIWTVSDLYAMSQGGKNEGDLECHWCCSACSRQFLHDDPAPIPFQRSKSTAKRCSSPYCCLGCWLWRRQRITVNFLSVNGGHQHPYKDRQCPLKHSWWITPSGSWALREVDNEALWNRLLDPPKRFALLLRTAEFAGETLIQLATANDLEGAKAETPLHFTVNNIPHKYTIYDVEQMQLSRVTANEPGVQALVRILGAPPTKKKEAIRPSATNSPSPKREIGEVKPRNR
jgi:hypothetical protein